MLIHLQKIYTLGTYVIQLDEKFNNLWGTNTTNSQSMMRANKPIVIGHGRETDTSDDLSVSLLQPVSLFSEKTKWIYQTSSTDKLPGASTHMADEILFGVCICVSMIHAVFCPKQNILTILVFIDIFYHFKINIQLACQILVNLPLWLIQTQILQVCESHRLIC